MKDENYKSQIERLQERLDSKTGRIKKKKGILRPKVYDVKDDFSGSGVPTIPKSTGAEIDNLSPKPKVKRRVKRSPFRVLLVVSIAFFLIASAAAGVLIWSNSNTVSTEKVDLSILAPASVAGAESFSLGVSVTNSNEVPLLKPKIIFTFPEGVRKADDLTKPAKRIEIPLETIAPRETIQENARLAFFGEENSRKTVNAVLQYTVEGSGNAVFQKTDKKIIELSFSPIDVAVDIFRKSPSDQDVRIDLVIQSNSSQVMRDLLLEAEYPSNFAFDRASPEAIFDERVWRVGTLKPGEEKKISITGFLTGNATEQKIFHFKTGIRGGAENGVGIALVDKEIETVIESPFVLMDILAGLGKTKGSLPAGSPLEASIAWKNNSGNLLGNLEVILEIAGESVRRSTIFGGGGYYNSLDETIVWNERTQGEGSSMIVIPAGGGGVVNFALDTYDPFTERTLEMRNPQINLKVTMSAERISESGVSESLKAYTTEVIKISTQADFSARASYEESPFPNSGPVPPKVSEQTTYTIFWTLKNSFNDIRDAKVTAILPEYVDWEGQVTPDFEDITYNKVTGEVTWKVGRLEAGAGIEKAPRQVAFQVAITPSLSQVGSSPEIVRTSTFTGVDAFTDVLIQEVSDSLTTSLDSVNGGSVRR